MKTLLGPLFLVLMSFAVISKAQDSTLHQNKGIISTLRQKINSSESNVNGSTDSLKRKLSTDTLKLPTDTLGLSKWKAKLTSAQFDSLKLKIAENKITSMPDSVTKRISKPIDAIKNRSDSLQQKATNFVQQRIDSAEQKLADPINKINSKITSLEKPLEQKIEGVGKSIDEKTNNVQSGIQQGFEKATDGTVKAPTQNLDIPDIDLGQKPGVPGVDLQSPNLPLVEADLPGVDTDLQIPAIPKESSKVPDVNLDPGQLKEKVSIPEVKNLPDVKSEIEDIDSKLADLEKYEQELKGLKNLDSASVETATKKAEERLMNMEQMKGVQNQMKIAANKQAEYDALVQRYRDTTLTHQEFTRKARNLVNEKINKNVPEVKEAMDALNTVNSVKEILNQKNNGLAGKPIGQRLIPGITIQSSKGEVFMIDFGLQLGYRLTGRLRSGVGGVYRVGFDESYNTFVKAQDIYGGRVYAQFLIRKGIYVHTEYELLNGPDILSATETRQNVSAGYFGIGKQFNISRKIKGHTLFMYRAELKGELPDQSKFNLRLGFDLRTDKKKRKL